MHKSISAKIMTDLLKLWPKYTVEECGRNMEKAIREGEKPCPPPMFLKTRYEDNEHGRIFHVDFHEDEDAASRYVIFYIHGGAYFYEIILPHWRLIEKLARRTGAHVIVPTYRLVPFATYKEAYELIVPVYKQYVERYPDKKFILMGDSAGGGFSLALAEYLKAEKVRLPDELILLSPWVDIVMDNEEIAEYLPKDPFLDPEAVKIIAKRWAGDTDLHDPRVSPTYGDLQGLRNVTVFVGTDGILYPDIIKFYQKLDKDPSNELIIGEEMNHVYPLLPILEARPAVEKIIQVVTR